MKKIKLIKGNITKLDVDAIVNAANKSLLGGGGVDGAIHQAAGPDLLKECTILNGCKTGEAKITKGYNLQAKYIIHTVGPHYINEASASYLASCYINSLNLAKKYNIHSIAFPSISTGAYGYPLNKAVPVAIDTINNWIKENNYYEMQIIICCYNDITYNEYKKHILLNKNN